MNTQALTSLSILHYRWGNTAEEINEELLTTTNSIITTNTANTANTLTKKSSRRLFEKPMCGKADMVWLLETMDMLPSPSPYLPSSLSSSLLSLSPPSSSQFSMNTSASTSTTPHWSSSLSSTLQSASISTISSSSSSSSTQQQHQHHPQIPNQIRRNVVRDLRRGLFCYLSGKPDEGGSLLLPYFQSEHHALYSRIVLQLVPSLPVYLLSSSWYKAPHNHSPSFSCFKP